MGKPQESTLAKPNGSWEVPGVEHAKIKALLDAEPELKDYLPLKEVAEQVGNEKLKAIQLVKAFTEGYANRTAFRWCKHNSPTPDFNLTLTYQEVWSRVEALASSISQQHHLVKRGDFIGIAGFTSVDWVIADMTGLYLGLVVVPLPLNVPPKDMIHILTESEAKLVFVSQEEVPSFAKVLPQCPNVQSVVMMDVPSDNCDLIKEDEEDKKALQGVKDFLPPTVKHLSTIKTLMQEGRQITPPVPFAVPGQDDWEEEPLLGLMYTSGSTGSPKGAMYPERLVATIWRSGFNWRDGMIPSIHLGFLPLNHIAGRVTMYTSLSKGGVVSFTRKADMSTLFEDMAVVRPTALMLVPRIANMAYETYKIMRTERLKEGAQEGEALEEELRKYIKDKVLGGRLLQIVIGSAPSSPEVTDFLSKACEIPFVEGYGSTEIGGITIDNHLNRRTVVAARLIDVPELGYSIRDRPYPRGEMLVITSTAIPGYFKNPAATADLIDSEGFYHTGDIMEQRGPDVFAWIDRRKNIIKLAQGEYVSVSRLEAMYSGHPDIDHVYLYGNSRFSYLVGVLVPADSLVDPIKASCSDEKELKEKLKPLLRQRLDVIAKENDVESYEIPRDFLVELEPFSKENNLLTDSAKIARGRLKEHYGERLEKIYTETEERRLNRLEQVLKNDHATVAEHVKAGLEMTLGVPEDVDMDATFAQLGGDSLSAVRMTEHLRSLSGVSIPVASLLNPTATLASIVSQVEVIRSNAAGSGNKGALDGETAYQLLHHTSNEIDVIDAWKVDLSKLILEAELHPDSTASEGKWAAEKASTGPVQVALLTGANGFLGRFFLLELLEKVGPNGRVVCIIRARDDAAAKQRLLTAVGAKSGEGLRGLIEEHEKQLEVYAGDVSQDKLGLKEKVYEELLQTVDLVVHAGALVNHTLSYKELFGPNVLGTVNIMRFCLGGGSSSNKPKPLHFISTVAAAFTADAPPVVTEDHLGTHLTNTRRTTGTYASGYGASKWVCEVLMQQLHASTGLPIAVFRCSMILPHTTLPGQINVADVFTRFLAGLIYTGIAPASMTDGAGAPPAYDGNPVDFDANAIISVACAKQAGLHLYHVINPHYTDGASMEDIIHWVESAGYSIDYIKPYEKWYKTFKSHLEGLPTEQKAQSPLPVIHQWEKPLPAREASGQLRLDATAFRKVVQEYTKWKDVPQLDEGYIHTCLDHMVKLDLIHAPLPRSSSQPNPK